MIRSRSNSRGFDVLFPDVFGLGFNPDPHWKNASCLRYTQNFIFFITQRISGKAAEVTVVIFRRVSRHFRALTCRPINGCKKTFIVVGVGTKHRRPKNPGDSGAMAFQQDVAVGGRSHGRSKRKFARVFMRNSIVVVAVENVSGAMATKI